MGFSVSKKIGNAVVRNRCRRMLREAVRSVLPEMAKGMDYIFVGRAHLAGADFDRVKKDVCYTLRRKHCYPGGRNA